MYNANFLDSLVDVSKCGIVKKCNNCRKIRKISKIEPEHSITHPITGDVFSNRSFSMCGNCADEYVKMMEDLMCMSDAYDETEGPVEDLMDINDVNDTIVIDISPSHCSVAFA